MLNSVLVKPVEIIIGEQLITFNALADFEFSLAGRTDVPLKRAMDMVNCSPTELKKEARTINNAKKRFVDMLTQSADEPASINRALRELNPQIFSQDYNWRMIMIGLNNNHKDELNPFRRVALIKYLQYLKSRQTLIKQLCSIKQISFRTTKETVAPEPGRPLDNISAVPVANHAAMERMIQGEKVIIQLAAGEVLDILLSKHQYKLTFKGSGFMLISQANESYQLNPGRNLVGRDNESDIILDPSLRDISRVHIEVNVIDCNTISIIDLSAHGTYLPKQYLLR